MKIRRLLLALADLDVTAWQGLFLPQGTLDMRARLEDFGLAAD